MSPRRVRRGPSPRPSSPLRGLTGPGHASGRFLSALTVSTEGGDPNAAGIALQDLRDSVKQSLARLGRQPDLLLIHNPFVPPEGKLVEFWKILEELKDDGTITASLGVSNFRPQVRPGRRGVPSGPRSATAFRHRETEGPTMG